ncbi:exo-beta-N-acetylmuramidase NamZ domain-containing protein [Natronogracilivirga saccharolytica]|uniref:DUF1343 domain-containing protein n=1 Tax=Natronogracilivirga saccharolytica TaxID=2812953 RepID=A0A8J7SA56_9BACT|nr:DUF1343 domain-containing protein [Natronogracilivirga saccharolytica]MBP3193253.1 DUF1343 domain-containing protein [Natronogracilivirga saccharolytica]
MSEHQSSRIPYKALSSIRFGVDTAISNLSGDPGGISEGSWGMVTNDAARSAYDKDLLSRSALIKAGVRITQLFAPEHGISRFGADGKPVDDDTDPQTGLPVCSLYGNRMRPPAGMLEQLDGVLFDIPDIGSRFYTYIWTLSHVMEACAAAGKPLVVLDRINPIGGEIASAEGPLLDTRNCSSFLGRAAIPVRHSLTAGEFAQWLNHHWNLDLDLRIIKAEGWHRGMHWPDTHLPFVPTSPAMPSYESALCYPGTCLFEATNLSAGRGTAVPFRFIGAPWLDPDTIVEAGTGNVRVLKAGSKPSGTQTLTLPGVMFHTEIAVPDDQPWKGQSCTGIRIEVADKNCFRPVRTGLALLAAIRNYHSDTFEWKTYPTAANPEGEDHFERLIGVRDMRPALEADPAAFLESLPDRLQAAGWKESVSPLLLY